LQKASVVPFREESRVLIQNVDSKENMELSSEDLTTAWRELSVESLGHCQPAGISLQWCVASGVTRALQLTLDSHYFLPKNAISTNRTPLNSLDYSPFESSHSSSVHSVEVFVFITFLESCGSSTMAFSLHRLSQGRWQKEPLV